jgi:hypothetical protein
VGTTHACAYENARSGTVNVCECIMRTLYRLFRREHSEQTETVQHAGLTGFKVSTLH